MDKRFKLLSEIKLGSVWVLDSARDVVELTVVDKDYATDDVIAHLRYTGKDGFTEHKIDTFKLQYRYKEKL